MQNEEKVSNTENSQSPSISNLKSKNNARFRHKYMALLSLLPKDVNYRKEAGLIKRIIDRGYTSKELWHVWNYWTITRKRTLNSFALLLWKECQLVKEALEHVVVMDTEKEEVKLENGDLRIPQQIQQTPKTLTDFLA